MNKPLTPEENAIALANWRKMPPDMRELVTALVDAGMCDGRRALVNARVAIAPDRLPPSGGVIPCIPTKEEREAMARAKSKR